MAVYGKQIYVIGPKLKKKKKTIAFFFSHNLTEGKDQLEIRESGIKREKGITA